MNKFTPLSIFLFFMMSSLDAFAQEIKVKQRELAKTVFADIRLDEIAVLLKNPFHEVR